MVNPAHAPGLRCLSGRPAEEGRRGQSFGVGGRAGRHRGGGGKGEGTRGPQLRAAGACLRAAALRPRPLPLGWQDGAGVSESAFLAQPDLSQKGELVQTERIIRLAKAANISQGPKLLPGRELLGRSLPGPSGFAESPVPPHRSFPQKRGQEGLRAERAGLGKWCFLQSHGLCWASGAF